MNKIIKKHLLNGDKCMSELHLKQQGCTDRACELFIKHRVRIKKFVEIANLKHLHRKN